MIERAARVVFALAIAMALSVCVPAIAFADNVKVKPSESVEVTLVLPGSDLRAEVYSAFKAKLSYDKGVFEPVAQDDIACADPWKTMSFNPETQEFAAASTKPVFPGAKVATVKLKALPDAKAGNTNISWELPVASRGAGDVDLPAVSVPVSVQDGKDSNGSASNGNVSGTPSQNPVGSNGPATDAVPDDGGLGDLAMTADGRLAETGDEVPVAPIVVIAVIAATVAGLAGWKSRRQCCKDAGAGMMALVLAVALGASGMGTAELAYAADDIDYDANRDGNVDVKDVEYVASVVVGLEPFNASADLSADGKCTVTDLAIVGKYVYALAGDGAADGNTSEDVPSPEKPATSESPSSPSTPETPSGPSDPGASEIPSNTDTPNAPSTPTNPGTPSDSSGTDDPNKPSAPSSPDAPSTPADPGNPDTPATPDNPDTPDPGESTQPDKYTFTQVTPQDIPVTYTEYQMRTDTMKELGYYGDHSQWPVGLEMSRDGALTLVGTDCCGLYRSDDQGQTWDQAQTGFNSLNVSLFAIDPHNSDHALALSGARLDDGKKYSGVYETMDGAHTWSQTNKVQPQNAGEDPYHIMVRSWRYTWDGFEFDPTTYNTALQKTTDVYLSLPYARDTDRVEDTAVRNPKSSVYTYLPPEKAGLYKSTDGGTNFVFLKQGLELCDGILKFTESGDMYIANQYGLHLVDKQTGDIVKTFFANTDVGDGLTQSTLGGKINFEFAQGKFHEVYKAYMGVTGFDVVGNTLYVQTWDGIYKSKVADPASDSDFEMITNSSYIKKWPKHLAVSKGNPNHMIMEVKNTLASYYTNFLYYTLDGGKTWVKSDWNQDTIFTQPTDWNSIERFIVYDETDPTGNTIVANGNGVITRSTDGGANFVQTNGISNIMAAGKFQLNYYNPDIITFGCQDFTGAISKNDGDTWTQMHARKAHDTDPTKTDNTRSMYAAFSPDGETVIGWGINQQYGRPTLMISREGGSKSSTWVDTGIETCITDNITAFSTVQSYNDPNVIISNEWRSEDMGQTWERMADCRTVYTINYTGKHEMYGGNYEGKPVVSYDDGKTWKVLCTDERFCKFYATVAGTEKIEDIAYDHVNDILYCVVRFSTQYNGGSINKGATRVMKMKVSDPASRKVLDVPFYAGYKNIRSVAVDPNSTAVLYVASVANNILNPTGLVRSINGGEIFTNLTSSLFTLSDGSLLPNKALNQGGYEPQYVRVDPRNGHCIIGTSCYGFEWINPPYDERLLNHSASKL